MAENQKAAKAAKDVKDMSFEDAIGQLQAIVKNLETGETSLEDSIKAYERGVALKDHCEKKLKEARSRIEKISINAEGDATATPLDNPE